MLTTPLADDHVTSLSLAKLFREHGTRRITSLQFDPMGEYCLTAGEDESLQIYDAVQGVHKNTIYSKKYGIDHVRYVPLHTTQVVHSSTKTVDEDMIRLLSLVDNRYLRYFRGHTSRIVSMAASPVDDVFLSAGTNEAIRMWDLRQGSCVGAVTVRGRPSVTFDPEGLVFAVALAPKILLYDVKSYDKGPFATYTIHDPKPAFAPSFPSAVHPAPRQQQQQHQQNSQFQQPQQQQHQQPHYPQQQKMPQEKMVSTTNTFEENDASHCGWSSVQFSPDGRYLLVSTFSDRLYLVDAFDGTLIRTFTGYANPSRLPLTGSWTPDVQFVLCSSEEGDIHVWETDTGRLVTRLKGHGSGPHQVQFNPRYMMMASACSHLEFWIPAVDL